MYRHFRLLMMEVVVIYAGSYSDNEAIYARRAAISDVCIRILLWLCYLRLGRAWTLPHQGLLFVLPLRGRLVEQGRMRFSGDCLWLTTVL